MTFIERAMASLQQQQREAVPGSATEAWLICDRCGDRERITDRTKFAHCPVCDAPRFARDAQGRNLICFSRIDDITNWGDAA